MKALKFALLVVYACTFAEAKIVKGYKDRTVTYFGGYLDEVELKKMKQSERRDELLEVADKTKNYAALIREFNEDKKPTFQQKQNIIHSIKKFAETWGYAIPKTAQWQVPNMKRSNAKCMIEENHCVSNTKEFPSNQVISATWIDENGRDRRFELYYGYFNKENLTRGPKGPIDGNKLDPPAKPGQFFTIAGKDFEFKEGLDVFETNGMAPSREKEGPGRPFTPPNLSSH